MELISEGLIKVDAKMESKDQVIAMFANILKENKRIVDTSKFIEDIYIREIETSTSMGLGVAIPHTQSTSVLEASLVFIKLAKAITWGNDDNVTLIFGIAVPFEQREGKHLKILSNLARKLIDMEFRDTLARLHTKKEALAFLQFINNEI